MHATFFIIGENGAANPRLVQRVLAEGHDLGNHTTTSCLPNPIPMTTRRAAALWQSESRLA